MAWPRMTRGEDVGGLPSGQVVPSRVPPRDQDAADEPSIEDATALEDGHELVGIGGEVAPVHEHQEELGSEQSGDEHPHRHVGDAGGVHTGSLRLT